jgi:hypothetical protein
MMACVWNVPQLETVLKRHFPNIIITSESEESRKVEDKTHPLFCVGIEECWHVNTAATTADAI